MTRKAVEQWFRSGNGRRSRWHSWEKKHERAVEKGLGRRQDEGGRQKGNAQTGKEPNKVQRIERHLVKERIMETAGPPPDPEPEKARVDTCHMSVAIDESYFMSAEKKSHGGCDSMSNIRY
ncbi:hypothetical protein FB45DRAFT_873563 [Roridomyces roridus]|uniref:Uncharacterized protein n=1 Tax=Roridomyces roridus TaxID=1738132 RepID=A0AAD7BAH4_9AGAR|nr:hypothetical protein FB45DRAFT_873563 [Roridomyces roridus]